MLFSTQTSACARKFGIVEACRLLMDAGYPALDYSFTFEEKRGYSMIRPNEEIRELASLAKSRGVIFNQAHAPFGGGYDYYTGTLVPMFPRVFEICAMLGIPHIVVHPLQRGRYYGNERELFDANVAFYRGLAPLVDTYGVKIAIENMWQYHPVNRSIVDDICANPAELAAMYDTLDDPKRYTVCLDVGHVMLCGREPEDAIRTLGRDRLGALHVHDTDYVNDLHTLPGVAKGDFDAVARALGEIDYRGEVTLEADMFFAKYPVEHYPAAARFMCETARLLADKAEAYRK